MKDTLPNLLTSFKARFNTACDDSPSIPDYGKGRQVYIAEKLGVSQEAVRKWFAGESTPRQEKMQKLAQLLDVDLAWLSLGISEQMTRGNKKSTKKSTDASVHLVMSTLLFKGASTFAPADTDPRRDFVDFYAGIRGEMHSIHVCSTREVSVGTHIFNIPREYSDVRCVAVIPTAGRPFEVLDLPTSLIDAHKTRKDGAFTLTIDEVDGEFVTDRDHWPKFNPLGGVEW